MQKYLPSILYLIAIILIYPLVMSVGELFDLLGGRGARLGLALYLFLTVLIIAAIIFLLYLASEIKQMRHGDD